jgi:peptide/nickel transport system substrate-binding protein
MGQDGSGERENWRVSRRTFVHGVAASSAVVGGAVLLGACGGDDDDNAAPSSENVRLQNGGTLRVGMSVGNPSDTFDPHFAVTLVDAARALNVFESLALRNLEFELEMLLAESIEMDGGPDSWTIRLKQGREFHNGKPVTADDVIFSIRRITDPKNPGTGAVPLGDVDRGALRKLDDRTVRVPLTEPNSAFPDDLGQYFNAIVPVDFDPKKPVGTGPFAYKSFTPGQETRMVKNANYWREGEPKVDEVVMIDIPDATARVNALLSGDVDMIMDVPASQISTVESSGMSTLVSQTGSWDPIVMNTTSAPFDDVRVREAMKLIIDRNQMIEQVLAGRGLAANDIPSPFDAAYIGNDIPPREQDLEQARSLLRQAGQSDLRVELVPQTGIQGSNQIAQVFAQQAEGAGVTVNLRQLDAGAYFEKYTQWPFTTSTWGTRAYLSQVGVMLLPGASWNETHWEDQEFLDLIYQARREVDEDKRSEVLGEAQQLERDRGGNIIWAFREQIDGLSAGVGGLPETKRGNLALANFSFRLAGIVA